MRNKLSQLLHKATALLADESGQDLLEYALVISLIAFGTAAVMTGVATKVSIEFSIVGSYLTTVS